MGRRRLRSAQPEPSSKLEARASDKAGCVSLRDVSRFDSRHRTPLGQRWWVTSAIVLVYLAVNVAVIVAVIPVAGLSEVVEKRVFGGFALATAGYTGFLALMIWRTVARRVRIDRFAENAGLVYSTRESLSRFAGTATRQNRAGLDVVQAPARLGGSFLAATFVRTAGFLPRRAAFVQVPLDRPTPHIVLLNRRSRVLGASGTRFLTAQRLKLEGNFDETFTLLCPAGYERDALYIFTPDVMALMLDTVPSCEIELIDGYLVAYSGHPWRLWRRPDFDRMLTLVDTLGGKARRQTRRYQDDRALPGSVASGGRRLRSRPSAGAVISLAAPLALGVAGLVSLFSA